MKVKRLKGGKERKRKEREEGKEVNGRGRGGRREQGTGVGVGEYIYCTLPNFCVSLTQLGRGEI